MSIPPEWAAGLASFMGMGRRPQPEDTSSACEKAAAYISGRSPEPGFTDSEMKKVAHCLNHDEVTLSFLARCNQTTTEKLASVEIVEDASTLAASSPARRYARGLQKIAAGIETSPTEFRLLCAKEGLSPYVLNKAASLFECSRDGLFVTHVNGGPVEGLEKEGAVCDFMETIGSPLALHLHDMEKVARAMTGSSLVPQDEIEKIARRVFPTGVKTASSAEDLALLFEEMEKLAINPVKTIGRVFKGLGTKSEKLLPQVQHQMGMTFGNSPRMLRSRFATTAEKGVLNPELPILQRTKRLTQGHTPNGKTPLAPQRKSTMTWAKAQKDPFSTKRPPERLTLPENLRGARPPSPAEQARMRMRLDQLNRQRAQRARQGQETVRQPQEVADRQQQAALDRLNRQRERRALERRQHQTERLREEPPRAPATAQPAAPATAQPAAPATAQPAAPATAQPAGPRDMGEWWAGMSPNERMALMLGGSYMGGQALGQ